MYLLSSVLLPRCRWIERAYFPVRSEFIYDHVGGWLANALVAGMAMYPPIYRQPSRRALNRDALGFLVNELQRPGTLVGMHPEGRRGTMADPYTLLPAQPGLGEVVHRAQPVVIPVFINGVPRNLFAALRDNFRRGHAPVTITITFGEPLTFDGERGTPPGARTSLRIAQGIQSEIERLGARDRDFRSHATIGASSS
jgi:1-acyl-sn-glycerol-3-phosphate acyltransferase